MQLYQVQAAFINRAQYSVHICIYKNTYFVDVTQLFYLCSGHAFINIPCGGRIKYKASEVGAGFIYFNSLLHLCNTTNFYSHFAIFAFSSFIKSAKAIEGLACFIKFSPIKKPLKPAWRKVTIVSTLLMPLSATAGLFFGILFIKSSEVWIFTSKVLRLRLFTPTISTSSHTC